MRKTVLTFGFISGVVMSAMLLVTLPFQERIGFDAGAVIGYTTMVAASLAIYFGVRRYRDDVAGGTVSFGRALGVGLLIAMLAGACYTLTWQVVYSRIGPQFDAWYQANAIKKETARGATPAELERKRAEIERFTKMYRNPAINAALTFLEPLPVGLLVALISAGLLSRRRDRPAESRLPAAV